MTRDGGGRARASRGSSSGTPRPSPAIERVLPADQFGPLPGGPVPAEPGPLHDVQARGARPGERQREVQRSPAVDDPEPVGRAAHPGAPVRQAAARQVPPGRDQGLLALVWELRKIKSPAELEVMRRAARIGVKAHSALIQSTRPGVGRKGARRRVRVRLRARRRGGT
ncbi:MAG: hypothetical protein MZW92_75830 [Comamonadaceae bacterium]|nr:hypothetical protein [Comamonadaceae bacterium]